MTINCKHYIKINVVIYIFLGEIKNSMDKKLHDSLIQKTEELRDLLAKSSTESIVNVCAGYSRWFSQHTLLDSNLTSPARQLNFLLGLMLSTPEPKTPVPFTTNGWPVIETLLNDIFLSYVPMFFPQSSDTASLTKGNQGLVAMSTFLAYFNNDLLASIEQLRDRIKRYLIPFDTQLVSSFDISATSALEIVEYLLSKKEKELECFSATNALKRIEYLSSKESKEIKYDDIRSSFGQDLADAYWRHFVTKRGKASSDFKYLTEDNIFCTKPLIETGNGIASLPLSWNYLFTSILCSMEKVLNNKEKSNSTIRISYLKHRDKALEEKAEEVFRRLFKGQASYYISVYETKDNQFEHDLIILWESNLFVIEIKASPYREPLRDPNMSFPRIKSDFGRTIEKAHEQADRVRSSLKEDDAIELYDKDGNIAISLKSDAIDNVYCICVTRDVFGLIATDLSLLLKKADDAPYPWAVNILDLENLIDAWDYFKWGPEKLCEYLNDREKLHRKVIADDELEFAGFFIKHGGFHFILNKTSTDRFFLNTEYSDVFTKIYFARRGAGAPVVYAPEEPVIIDPKQEFAKIINESKESPMCKQPYIAKSKKIGRNERCPCGSGKKYKKCCLNKV